MLKSLRIRNYRVFKDIEVGGLKRINLIAGKNNSGKTSLLEAILLLSRGADPTLALNESVIRGAYSESLMTPRATAYMWRALFNDLDTGYPIEISCETRYSDCMKLAISVDDWQSANPTLLPLAAPKFAPVSEVFDGKALTFQFCDSRGETAIGQMRFVNDTVEPSYPPGGGSPFSAEMVESRSTSQYDANDLGKLRTLKQSEVVLDALRMVEPKLQSVEDNSAVGFPMIWGDNGLSELMPLATMGEGMNRLARIILAMSAGEGRVVLIDEIENGFHHSVMDKVWKAIGCAAERFDTQVFATTHSYECIQDAYKGLGKEGFRYFRVRRTKEGGNQSVIFSSNMVETAFKFNMEIR